MCAQVSAHVVSTRVVSTYVTSAHAVSAHVVGAAGFGCALGGVISRSFSSYIPRERPPVALCPFPCPLLLSYCSTCYRSTRTVMIELSCLDLERNRRSERMTPSRKHRESSAQAPVLVVEHFSKAYGKKRVVEDVSFSVGSGSVFGFVGPNGAGKTTLIRSIVGALAFDAGDVRICGQSVLTDPVACKRETAYVPDNPDIYGFLTGMQYLNYIADLFDVKTDARAPLISAYAGRLGIEDRLGEMVSAYSHGMRQKLVLVGAFLHEPRLLVLDEPFVGLDSEAAYELRAMIREIAARGSAVFLSSHVLDIVEKLCHEIAIIRRGKIVRAGTVEEIRGDEGLEQVFLEIAREA